MKQFFEWAKGLRDIIAVTAILGSIAWFALREPLRASMGIPNLEQRIAMTDSLLQIKTERINFLAVVTVCNSGKYTPEEIAKIKAQYRVGRLDIDLLIAEWYEK